MSVKSLKDFFFVEIKLVKIFWKIFLGRNYERVSCPIEIPPLEFGRKAPPAMKKVPRNRAGINKLNKQ